MLHKDKLHTIHVLKQEWDSVPVVLSEIGIRKLVDYGLSGEDYKIFLREQRDSFLELYTSIFILDRPALGDFSMVINIPAELGLSPKDYPPCLLRLSVRAYEGSDFVVMYGDIPDYSKKNQAQALGIDPKVLYCLPIIQN